ncbi:MAG: transporter substrate-binding domain-containing protein, partial [Desulfobacterales bacterium]|nr:transporter substrate-binding domain-containing protein [Desulfobacterales bacterium]
MSPGMRCVFLILGILLVLSPVPCAGLTPDQRDFLVRHPVLRVSISESLPPYTFIEDGEARGYWIDLMNRMFEKTGSKLTFHGRRSLRDFEQILNQGRADILTSMLILPDRKKRITFSTPVVQFSYPAIIMKSQDIPLNSAEDLAGRKVALVKGHPFERALSHTGIPYHGVYADSIQQTLEMVAYGQADATLQDNTVAAYFSETLGFTNLRPTGAARFPGMARQEAAFAVAKDNRILADILNHFLENMDGDELALLRKKWFFPETGPNAIPLTEGEKAWIRIRLGKTPELPYCIDPGWMPFEGLSEAGNHEGMTADLIRDMESRLGIPLKLIPTETWDQSLEFIRQGKCMFLPAAGETAARQNLLDFTHPWGAFPLVVAVRNQELFVEDLAAIRDKTLGMVRGYAHIDLVRGKYPNLKIIEVDSVTDGLIRVREKEIFGYVDTVPTIGYVMRRQGMVDLKIGGKLDIPLKLSMAVGKTDAPGLIPILNKVLAGFSEKKKQILKDKWFSIRVEKVFDYDRLWQVLGVGILVLCAVLFWVRKLALLNRTISQKEALMRSTIESTRDGILVVDDTGRVTHSNPGFQKIWNIPDAVMASGDDDRLIKAVLVQIDDPEGFLTRIRELYRSNDIADDLIHFKDGRIIKRHSRPLVHQKRITGRVWSFEDITDQMYRESKLQSARDKAEVASQAKSRFLANMSHEIRTPLNPIIGLTHLALAADPPPRIRDYLSKIRISSRSLQKLINDILDFSKIEAGKLNTELTPFSLDRVLENLHTLYEVKAREKQLRFTLSLPDETPRNLVGDPMRLEQVLGNLISNAIKFTEQGAVSLALELIEQEETRAILEFSVRDTGIGMDEAQQETVFKAFTQADGSTTRKYGGTGLGLAICRHLVSLMGSDIRVESAPGKGSRFFFRAGFDLAEPEEVRFHGNEPLPLKFYPRFKDLRALVAEDNPTNQQVALELLKAVGFEVVMAENGQKAVEALGDSRFDVVLMDIQMPETDGYEATRIIRRGDGCERLPI